MCYAKPGGRCSPVAQRLLDKREREFEVARERAFAEPNNKRLTDAFLKARDAHTNANREFAFSPIGRLVLAERAVQSRNPAAVERALESYATVAAQDREAKTEENVKRRGRWAAKKPDSKSRGQRKIEPKALGFDSDLPQDLLASGGPVEQRFELAHSSQVTDKNLQILARDANRAVLERARAHIEKRGKRVGVNILA